MSDYIKREDAMRAITKVDCDDVVAKMAVGSVPAADVAEVKHGKWIKATVSSGRESWECSVCHRRARGKKKNLPYCHCGAKMDLED